MVSLPTRWTGINEAFWLAVHAYVLSTPLGYIQHLVAFHEQYGRLPVAAKYHMTSVPSFMTLETAFALLQFAVACARLTARRVRPARRLA